VNAVAAKSARASVGEVRIIAGQWKRSQLPVATLPGLRPTPNRVRETLFNWLGHDLKNCKCLDAFAGTGALGFEAASRGAREVLCVEQDARLVAQLQKNKTKLQASTLHIQRGDALLALQQAREYDLVFLDPPFNSSDDFFRSMLHAASQAMRHDGFVYLEAPRAWTDAQLQPLGLQTHRTLKAGAVHAHLLTQYQPPSCASAAAA
jgi:16S rRNA (guanine966-N2)-methyltransferase